MNNRLLLGGLVALSAPFAGRAQFGDTPGEGPQVPLPAAQIMTPAPAQSPAAELATFQLPPGFRIELVAAEPTVHDPVAAAYDGNGDIWVAEMTPFNAGLLKDDPDLTGGAREVPAGKIVKLESTRHDGVYDRRTVWLDGLRAPRAISFVHDGLLIADPPNLWLARDAHGTGKCDEKKLLVSDFGAPGSEEGSANGLLWGRDNLLHNISFEYDYRYKAGAVERLSILVRGQFGLAQDDYGRLFYSRNSDQLRSDLYSPQYNLRNPHVTELPWANVRVALDQIVWPSHPTPAVNRGYRRGVAGQQTGGLRDDATLLEVTAACSAQVYRATNFPTRFYGNVFVPEPAANLIHRDVLLEAEGRILAADGYEGREFLTSTDSRFRPVALTIAPDGSMLVVDFYRGLLEDYHMMTSYLRAQTKGRDLDAPLFGQGRLWRIVYEGGPLQKQHPDLYHRTSAELAGLLVERNSWWREWAQREIVERGDQSAVPALVDLARRGAEDFTRVAAWWTLDGLHATSVDLLKAGLTDRSAKVRSAVVRLHERWLREGKTDDVLAQLAPLARDQEPEVVVQLALSVGEASTPKAMDLLAEILWQAGDHPYIPKAIATGLKGREAAFFDQIARELPRVGPRPDVQSMLTVLSSAIVHEGNAAQTTELVRKIAKGDALPEWARRAALTGFENLSKPAFRRTMGRSRIPSVAMLQPLTNAGSSTIAAAAKPLIDRLARIEQQDRSRTVAAPLTAAEQERVAAGKTVYQICSACHGTEGTGLPNVAPSLVDSHWVVGRPEILIRILLNGKEGTPGFPGAMPPLGAGFDDAKIAEVLTYIRNSWGLQAGAVNAETVAAVRKSLGDRQAPWTDSALQRAEADMGRKQNSHGVDSARE